jgi:hypothetical protein
VARLLLGKLARAAENFMNRLLVAGILIISTAPLFAQAQPDPAKLKADAQNVVSIIKGDKAKTQTYCRLLQFSDEFDQFEQKDRKKADDLSQKIGELEKTLGPEYLALADSLNNMDPNSREGEEIASIFENLDKSCPH